MIRGVNLKLVAICLMLLFIFQIAFPTVSFALTGGPSQPETTAFTPVGASELVDMATGDFNYSIPLMTVPGPNGGESLTLGYKAGVTMEQEASWVGLGWDLNVGAINRNLRGLPDDFKGDDVVVNNLQKNRTINKLKINPNLRFEISGVAAPSLNGNLYYISDSYYNDYVGFGLGAGLSFGKTDGKTFNSIFGLNAGLDFSKDGLNIPIGYFVGNKLRLSMGANYGGVQSLQNINFGLNYQINKYYYCSKTRSRDDGYQINNYGVSSSYSFAKSAPVGEIETISSTVNERIGMNSDIVTPTTSKSLGLGGDWSITTINYSGTFSKKGYGYLYSDSYNKQDEKSLYDVHKENNVPFEDAAPTLPVPVFDYDLYSVSGNGVGGTFRAFRSDIGVLNPPKVQQTTSNGPISGSVQIGTPQATYYGVDIDVATGGQSYTGPWRGKSNNLTSSLEGKVDFREQDIDKPLYKPFYFEFLGSQETTNEAYLNAIKKEEPVQYGVYIDGYQTPEEKTSLGSFVNGEPVVVTMKSKFGKLSKRAENLVNYSKDNKREVTGNHIGYKTQKEIIDQNIVRKNIFSENIFPFNLDNSGNSQAQNIPYSQNGQNHHINEMTVSSGGVEYVYGLPAYNLSTKEYMYSAKPQENNPHLIKTEEHKTSNSQGYDNLIKTKTIPSYAYSYLLTEKYSNNYVDITGDGPTEDDLGGWVKYNYSKISDFKWRGPYGGSSYIKGSYSWDEDDKATFTEGSKDIHYINSIESKTHIAIFEVGERDDNVEAGNDFQSSEPSISGGTGTKRSRYLKTIKLYSKNDKNYGDITKMVPIKTIHFEYDYSLCQGVRNYNKINSGVDSKHIKGQQGGKLTLKRIYFTYQNNEKGSLTPYDFYYGDITDKNNNPDYVYMDKTDRWGNYHSAPAGFNSKEYPYVNQQDNSIDVKASVWNLKEIGMPSGGKIQVEYEADDYGYVQDEQAMQMFKIVGVSGTSTITSGNTGELTHQDFNNTGLSHYIFFEGNNPINSQSEIDKYFKNLSSKWLYFDANISLKGKVWDYRSLGSSHIPQVLKDKYPDIVNSLYHDARKIEKIKGYAEIEDNSWGYTSSGIGYFKVKSAKYKCGKNSTDIGSVHPFRKAAIQHYHNRPDLKPKDPSIIEKVRTFLNGPIQNHLSKGRGQDIVFNDGTISSIQNQNLIRLLNPDFDKKGGGHRVKTIKINDLNGKIYGQKYSYTRYNKGIEVSSGVADYEPIVGGEENSLKQPVNYAGVLDYNTNTESSMYVQKPILEAFYPGAIVKYGQVTVRNLTPTDIGRTTETVANNGGVTVTEHYTSKDFPVIEKTPNKWVDDHYKRRMVLPFVPRRTEEDNKIFSSASVIILNDMSGKVKSVATFDGATKNEDLTDGNAKTKVKYLYHTDSDYPNRLNNKVTVLKDDDIRSEAIIGQKQDFYVYQQENLNLTKQTNAQVNILPSLAWPFWPVTTSTKSISQRRTISTVKIIQKTGILKEVITKDDGRTTYASNLAFDAYTGEAIVTKVRNDWDKPIYSFNYAAHWKYPALKGKYQNYRAKFKVQASSPVGWFAVNGVANSVLSDGLIQLGDVLKRASDNELFYVTDIDYSNALFKASKKDNSAGLASGDIMEVIESGYKNLQQGKVGNIVSLTNPLNFNRPSSFLHLFLTKLDAAVKSGVFIPEGQTLCSSTVTLDFNNVSSESSYTDPLHIKWPYSFGENCTVNFYDKMGSFSSIQNFLSLAKIDLNSLRKGAGGDKYLIDYSWFDGTTTQTSTAKVWTDCEVDCEIEGVLHASAMEMADDWDFNYKDAGNPKLANGNYLHDEIYTSSSANLYAYKKKGSWLPWKSWVYQIDRKQSGTSGQGIELDKDGEYSSFKLFRWDKAEQANRDNRWEWTNKMTQYSPFGYDVENENRIGIASSELYGYKHSVVTAVGANAGYKEIAFEGFEEVENPLSTSDLSYDMQGHFTGTVQTRKFAHTGNRSLLLGANSTLSLEQTNFKPKASTKYFVSAWVRTHGGYGGHKIVVKQNNTIVGTLATPVYTSTYNHKNQIDGWTKIEGSFTTTNTSNITLEFITGNTFTLFDDLRICPYEGALQTYVYDPLTLNLIATLDNNNFATFYVRDSEGKVTLIKKETEKGIITVQSKQENIAK